MELSDYRDRLDNIDGELVRLFTQRMDVAAEIAEFKKGNGLNVLDAKREQEKLLDIARKTPEDIREYAVSLFSLILELSRSRQNRLLGVKSSLTDEISRAIAATPPNEPGYLQFRGLAHRCPAERCRARPH